MRRALTKIVTVLVQSILVICSLGFVCVADKIEAPSVREVTKEEESSDAKDDTVAPKYYFRTIEVDDINPVSKKAKPGTSKAKVVADSGIYRYQMIGNQKIAYEKIRNCIIDVANGTSACTKFTVTFAELGLGDHHEYTAEELGVSSIIADG